MTLELHAIRSGPPRQGAAPRRRRLDRPVLDGVQLTVHAGERVGLLGASGAGKTTLLRIALAIDTPDSGTLSYDGRPIRPGPVRRLRWFRRQVQYVPQEPAQTLPPRRAVLDIVRDPLDRLTVPGDRDAAAREALVGVGLGPALWSRRPHELSGGQAQRVAVARAIACRPRLLVADEPISGLDLPLRATVLELLSGLASDHGRGLLVVSHDLSALAGICTRLVVLADGRVAEDGPTAQILASPGHAATAGLLAAVPRFPAPEPKPDHRPAT